MRISRGRLAWIEEQSAAWRDTGLIDEATRTRILDRYTVESNERRSMIALVLVAVLMCGIGLLLLIGYNWARIPAAAKVTSACLLVAATFVISALAYARGRATIGEILAFAGTFVFGNAIWLIAGVLHIEGHYPDGFWWFGVGALSTALLLGSIYVGFGAALLFGFWIIVEGASSSQAAFSFLPVWTLLVVHAYRMQSPALLRIVAFLAPLWVFAMNWDESAVWFGATVLTAGAVYFAGGLIRSSEQIRGAWQSSGLTALLVALIPLMVSDVHEDLGAVRPIALTVATAAIAGAITLWGTLTRLRDVKDVAVGCVLAATAVWTIVVGGDLIDGTAAATILSATILFSAATLGLAVSLIRGALRSSSTQELVFGVVFALAFLIVRWVSVLENLLWSGALLVATGAALLWIARLWRTRERPPTPTGSAS